MTANREYVTYVLDLLEPVLPVRTNRFFGGVGISSGPAQFAMIMKNSLYFVVDDTTRPTYERAGMGAFSYVTKKGRIQVRRYFELPEEILLDPVELLSWARESIRIARDETRKKKKKPRRR
ncbi:MAG: TfoX/Sxy family protein [Gammaproteobacteria bacterium]|nr:TfoX/Sxy family protein [Gammaproteobacteria bacterium]